MWSYFSHFTLRFRYPVSMPSEVADALGIELSSKNTLEELIRQLLELKCRPQGLMKYMKREAAENRFQNAVKKERFNQKTLFSYYFNQGWVEFMLQFDDESRLRRLYLYHYSAGTPRGIEIPLIFRG